MKNLLSMCFVSAIKYRVQESNKVGYCNNHKRIFIDKYFSVIYMLKSVKGTL